MTNKTGERGPVYDVELIDSLPIGGMWQAMPGRKELERVRQVSERTVAAYEVLLQSWHETSNSVEVEELKRQLTALQTRLDLQVKFLGQT